MTPQFWQTLALFTLAGAVFAVMVRLLLPRVLAWRGVWFTWHTMFGPALVFDSQDEEGTPVRFLNVNGTFQSVCYTDEELLWDPVCEYHRSWAYIVHAAWPLTGRGQSRDDGRARRALVMGGGGFSFPKWLVAYRPDFACTTAEIDTAIVAIAHERFFLEELTAQFDTASTGRLEICVNDAWDHLGADTLGYDLIINDAFRGNKPLGNMETSVGAHTVQRHLLTDGIYIGNVRTPLEGRRNKPLLAACEAFAREFAFVWIIPERPEEPTKPGNNALVASNRPLRLGNITGVITYSPKTKGPHQWQTIS